MIDNRGDRSLDGRQVVLGIHSTETRESQKEIALKILAIVVVALIAAMNTASNTPGQQPQISLPSRSSALFDTSWITESDQAGANLGYSVSSAGDVNNDGYDDVIVGAYNYDNGQTDEGRAFLYLGSSTGLSASPSWTAESDQAYARFGYSVSTAGDVNNDGYSDVIVGAYVYDNGQTDEGRAYLYLGSASGLSISPAWTAESDQASAYFGSTVSSAGDVNNDGYDDVVIAALFYTNGESMEGRVHLYLGMASGLSASPSWTAEGNQAFAYFGRSVSSAGDVDNDGHSDVIVGAYYYDKGQTNEGCAFLYLGSPSGLSISSSWTGEINQADAWFGYSVSSAGDVNKDGFSDVIVGAVGYDNGQTYEGSAYLFLGSSTGLSASPAWSAEGDQDTAYFGVVASAGDVNNDGYGDVVVGAYMYSNGQEDEGRIFLYLGSSTGLPTASSWTAESNQTYTMFGSSLSSAGDVNNDGASDIIVGAYSYDNGQNDEGRAYVYYGHGAPPPGFTLTLVKGWNFVTVPIVGSYKASTIGLLRLDVVASWNPATQLYDKTYIVGVSPPSLDIDLLPNTGYWISASADEILPLAGSPPAGTQTRTVTLPSSGGWVNLGLMTLNTTWKASNIPGMFSGGTVTTVSWYNPATMIYKTYITGVPPSDFTLVPGQAYWCYCTSSGTFTFES